MFIFSMLVFFLLLCCGAWLLLFPASRDQLGQSWGGLLRRVDGRMRGLGRDGAHQAGQLGGAVRAGAFNSLAFLRRRFLLMIAASVLLTVPVGLAWLLGGNSMLDGFDGSQREVNPQVAELLKGELLAPPVPLPPLTFTTVEVVQVRPLLDSANRNWRLLDDAFAQRLLLVFKMMKEQHGYDMAILEGYRSPERQNLLAAAGSNVTNARAFQSYHQFGLAADCAFLRDGKLVISEKDPWAMRGYRLYGELAESAGLHWGGRWAMMDFGHTELRVPGTVRK
ncbi:M15 family metallopeptidase [Oxalobacteraceae bacterium]|nr:M15 family metallopeptidase [Oxalobacteraceae bacterium]